VKWTDEEIEVLKRLWMNPKVTKEDLLRVFPYRSWDSIDCMARRRLGLPCRSEVLARNIDWDFLKKLEKRLRLPDRRL